MVDIALSVIDSRSQDLLAGCTSLHDIWVAPKPLPEPPSAVVHVRAPDWRGEVVISHESASGSLESISRPPEAAVALFWGFIVEKFGLKLLNPPGEG